ncbi:MAG: hypothetical protein H8D33_01560 [Cryomorphaceae bacterium]|nr:hypothetical protein [Cryomorphaceae bacterium]
MANATFKKGLILFVLTLVFSFSTCAQKIGKLKEFSKDFSIYLAELSEFMTTSDNSDLKTVFKSFSKNSSELTAEEKEIIILISNKMLDKRMRANPHFSNVLSALMNVNNHVEGKSMLPEWLGVIDQTVDNTTTKKLMLFCAFTDDLVKENILRKSKTAAWLVNTNDYSFDFEIIEPIILFNSNFNLSCSADGGSYTIEGTKGKYYFVSNEWEGTGGKINWESHGLAKDSVYATISNYKIDTRKSQLLADSAVFYNKYIFPLPIVGQFVNKLASAIEADKFPKFTSYSKNIELKEIFPNVDYKGGYKMQGKEFIADGGDYAQARIIFKRNGFPVFVANANRFSLGTDRIISKGAGIKIFFDTDSIYHANLQFKYINSERKLQLYRDINGISGAPMLNTYHNITMDFELLEWNIDGDIITFGSLPGTAESRVELESVDRYLQQKYESMQGIDAIHPLFLVNNYVIAKQEEKFFVDDFTKFSHFPAVQIQHYLIQLANDGFIFYDYGEERITVLPKLYTYINAASGLGDYDVIAFNSIITPGEYNTSDKYLVNAALNIETKDLNILGIHNIQLSEARDVYLYPTDGLLVVKKNRDFIFNGQIYAGRGRLNLFGKNFFFHYDEFKVDLNEIDSVQLSVPVMPIQKDMYGNEFLTKVKTVIEAVTGDLRIDDPTNKSGLRKDSFPGFPIFRSFEDSYAYYDRKTIYDGIYDRDRFSFHLLPFEIDSLDNYTGKGLAFAGTFESAGIFPTFDDTLRLQEDYSLGFTRKTPADGFAIYGGKGKYHNDIHLSHKGLRGSGDFEYLTAKASSEEIFFFPDSTNLYTQTFTIDEVISGIEFPQVSNTETYAHFLPYQDRLEIDKRKDEFDFYKGQASFNGNLLMQPTGVTGGGIMTLDKAEVNSNLFTYNASWFGSDTASLNVFESGGAIAFKANNLRTHIDMKMREGVFHSNGSGSFVELPANQYICYIDKLKWAMDEELLTLGDEVASSKGSEFISIHPHQDSLSFMATTANYSLKDYIIHANGVQDISVADAIIYPDSGIVTVEKKAVIQTLYGAKILADDLTEYHTFSNASVDIISAHNYTATGDYTYTDAMNQKQQIFFKEIRVGEDTITMARGDVETDKPFHIDSKFDFKGSLDLFADRKNLIFDGYLMANHSCELLDKEWVKFRSEIDPKNIVFTLDEKLYNDKQDLISTGLVMSLDSTNIYSTFLSRKVRAIDADLLKASYSLYYDKKQFAYVIGGPDTLSSYFTLYDKTCKTKGEGLIDMNLDLGQIIVTTSGSFTHDMINDKKEFEGFFMLDFFFSEKAMQVMAKDIYSAPGDGMFEYDHAYANNLGRIVGKEKGDMLMLDLELKDEFVDFPKEMSHTLSFTKAKFKWDNINKAYVAKGGLWLGNINESQINGLLDGYIIIEKGRNSDVLTIYLQTEFYDEYYFKYKNGVLLSWSTNEEFNIAIREITDAKRKAEPKKGATPFRYMSAPEDVTEKFLKSVKKKY